MRYDWKAGSWIWPWLAGLVATSYLGSFGGGKGVIGFGDGILILLGLSVVIYIWAIKVRLPTNEMIAYIETDTSPVEPELSGH